MMMGFTFAIGIALAYVIKVMIWVFLGLNKKGMHTIVVHYKAYVRNNRIEKARIAKAMKIIDDNGEIKLFQLHEDRNRFDRKEKVRDLYAIARMHFSDKKDGANDNKMDSLYEYHHGKI